MGFVAIEALRDEDVFEIAAEGIEGAGDRWRLENGLILKRGDDVIAEFVAAPLEED